MTGLEFEPRQWVAATGAEDPRGAAAGVRLNELSQSVCPAARRRLAAAANGRSTKGSSAAAAIAFGDCRRATSRRSNGRRTSNPGF